MHAIYFQICYQDQAVAQRRRSETRGHNNVNVPDLGTSYK